MKNTKVKICGIMREEDIETCVRYGTDIVGFVVEYPVDVPWNLERERAKELIEHFRNVSKKSNQPVKCCIVSGGNVDKLEKLVQFLEPDYIQMHYKENAKDVEQLKERLAGTKTQIIKTVLNVSDAPEFEKSGADILLVDARNSENAANSKATIDEEMYNKVRSSVKIPVMAAGGIMPENVAEIVNRLQPEIIDLMTGVEDKPGQKSEEKIRNLFEELKSRKRAMK